MADTNILTDTPTYAELAAMVTELIDQVVLFKNQQIELYTTQNQTAVVTDGDGTQLVIPSWEAVQSAGSSAGDNAELAAASIYKFANVEVSGTAYSLPSSNTESWYNITLNNSDACAFTIPKPSINSTMVKQITLNLIQGTGANKVAWPNNVKWSNGRPPVLSFTPGASDMVTLLYAGSAVGWIGFFSAGGIGE